MDLIACWLVAPAGLLLITVGLSLLIERLAEFPVPWTVRPALGLAAAVVVAQVTTALSFTAGLTIPAIIVASVLGLLLGYGIPDSRPDRLAVAIAVGIFLLYAAPFLARGEATWAGFIKLDDSATWMALTDHVFHHGRDLSDVAPSTYSAVLDSYLSGGYPIGAFVPMALMSAIAGQDVAWTMQPSMAFAAAAMGLLIFELVRGLVRAQGLAAVVAVTGSLSSLLLGYSLWGGVKELVAAAMLPLLPALVAEASKRGWPRVAFLPLGISGAAIMGVFGPGGAVWLGALATLPLLWLVRDRGIAAAARFALPAAALIAALALPLLITPNGLFNPLADVYTSESELGNLTGPLNPLHLAGFWPSIDFRTDPHLKPAILGLALLGLTLAAVAIVVSARDPEGRGIPFASYSAGGTLGAIGIILVGSPWVDGKAMATVSPALLAAVLLALALLRERTAFRMEATVLGAIVIAVTAWSAFLAYQGVWFAPRAHYAELEQISERFAGQGPALVGEVSIYGPRHFLRRLDAEGATDLRIRQVLLTGGRTSSDDQRVDLDEIQTDQFDPYNLVIVRRGPTQSRPPAGFELDYSGKYYEVWRRLGSTAPNGTLVEHLPLGNELDAGAVPSCTEVRRLAAEAGDGGTLVAAPTSLADPITVHLGKAAKPASWGAPTTDTVTPPDSGVLTADFTVSAAGRYQLWLAGGVHGRVEIDVDGEPAGSERGALNNLGGYEPLSTLELGPGPHTVELRYSGAGLAPGSAVVPFAIGPLILEPVSARDAGLVTMPAGDYASLCGGRWDWIEAYDNG